MLLQLTARALHTRLRTGRTGMRTADAGSTLKETRNGRLGSMLEGRVGRGVCVTGALTGACVSVPGTRP